MDVLIITNSLELSTNYCSICFKELARPENNITDKATTIFADPIPVSVYRQFLRGEPGLVKGLRGIYLHTITPVYHKTTWPIERELVTYKLYRFSFCDECYKNIDIEATHPSAIVA